MEKERNWAMGNETSYSLEDFNSNKEQKSFANLISDDLLFSDPFKVEEQSLKPIVSIDKRVWTGSELWNLPLENADNLAEPIYKRVGLGAVVGGSDTGKSMYLLQLAIDIVSRKSHHIGFQLNPKHHAALMLCAEDSEQDLNFRIRKKAVDIPLDNLSNLVVIVSPENGLEEAETQLKLKSYDLIIVDPWGDISGIDPSDNGKVRLALKGWANLAHKYQCLIIFLHHTGKTTDGKTPSKHNAIGAQSFEAKMRCVVELRKDLEDEEIRHFCIVKANGLPQTYKNDSFVLNFDPETFLFTDTGERRPFDELVSPVFKVREDITQEKYSTALRLQNEGSTLDTIARVIGFAGKSSVSKLLKKGKVNGWDVSSVSTGNQVGN